MDDTITFLPFILHVNYHKILIPVLALFVFLAGCASNSTENPNLTVPISHSKAEIVGSKIVGDAGIPHQVFVSGIDGIRLTYNAVDLTRKIWPVEPGLHRFSVSYSGSTGKIFIKPFAADGEIETSLAVAHRYVLKIRKAGPNSIVFYFEDTVDAKEAGTSAHVQLIGIPIPVFLPR